MNSNPSSGASGKENFPNMQPNAGQAALAPNQFNPNNLGMQQFRPRMEQPLPNGRNEPLNQQQTQQQHQRNMQMNYQQNARFPGGEHPIRFPPNHSNGPNQHIQFQRSPGGFSHGSRMQMNQQPRFPDSQLQMRPLVSNPNFYSNQPRPQNFQQMDQARPLNQLIPPNHNVPQTEDYQRQNIRDPPPILSRKSSELDIVPANLANTFPKLIRNESQSRLEMTPDNNSKQVPIFLQEEPDGEISKTEVIESDDESENKDDMSSDAEDTQNDTKADKKSKDVAQKDIKKNETLEEGIIGGTVLKNIKFFEDKDTAKTPLIPQQVTVKKKERKTESSQDVVKCQLHEDEYESGVDETPMVYPNLGSIFEAPRKVAKIPYRKVIKGSGKLKSDKKSRPPFQVYFKSRQGLPKPKIKHPLHKIEKTKLSKVKNFGPDEELLAFFENSDSWRKLKSYGDSKVDRNASKNRLENKSKANGDIGSPKKTPSKLPASSKKNQSPARTPLKSPGTPALSLPKSPDSPAPSTPLIKKVPMNKIQVGAAPSPNLKTVKSKVGSLANTTHKPGGGNIKIESHKIDLSNTQARIEAKNDQYKRSGGDKKIPQVKLQWSAKSKIGSLENATYKPGGGDKKIESVKLEFKEKAKPKVGSKDNVKHVPGGGNVKIENQKLEFKGQSKVGSLDNVKHKPGGGDVKIFDDKTYLRQISGTSSEGRVSGTQSYGDLSVVKEVEGRSAPGTPGRKTSVKIKKTTTLVNGTGITSLKNITEVTVTSRTPKKERNVHKSPSKQQVKLIYSKISTNAVENSKSPVEITKTPGKSLAPVLKPNLSKKDVFDNDRKDKEVEFDYTESSKEVKNYENLKQSSTSSNLSEGKLNVKDDGKMLRDVIDFTPTQEKIGEIWKEMNLTEDKRNECQQSHKQPSDVSSTKSATHSDSRPLMSQTLGNDFQKNLQGTRIFDSFYHQNIRTQEIYQPTPFSLSQQETLPSQKKFPPTQNQEYTT